MMKALRGILRRLRSGQVEALADEKGATMLEYALLLGAIAFPSYLAIRLALTALIGHYQLMTALNGMPGP